MAFAVLSLAQVAHTFNMRSRGGGEGGGKPRNTRSRLERRGGDLHRAKHSDYFPPLAAIFKVMPLSFGQWACMARAFVAPLLLGRDGEALE